jgi:hypothetical protein
MIKKISLLLAVLLSFTFQQVSAETYPELKIEDVYTTSANELKVIFSNEISDSILTEEF